MNEASTPQPTETVSQAIERLRLEKEANPGPPKSVPRTMRLNTIQEEPQAFQVRLEGLDEERVEELSQNLDDMALADRVRVWWSGNRWILIDGHHRLAAYRLKQLEIGEALQVPVEAHSKLSFSEALGVACKVNAREKVTINREDKSNAAWRLVCLGEGSIQKQAEWSGASKQLISIMRATLKRLQARKLPTERLIDQGWDWSRKIDQGNEMKEFSPEAAEAMAREWSKKIAKATGGKVTKCPDIFARAIELISDTLPEALVSSDPFWAALDGPGRALLKEVDEEELENEQQEAEIEDF